MILIVLCFRKGTVKNMESAGFQIYDFVCFNVYTCMSYIHEYVAFTFITLFSVFKAICFKIYIFLFDLI